MLITDKRLILFAQRGYILRSDDIVSERLDRLQGLEYSEKGLLFRTAKISIQGTSKIRSTRVTFRNEAIVSKPSISHKYRIIRISEEKE